MAQSELEVSIKPLNSQSAPLSSLPLHTVWSVFVFDLLLFGLFVFFFRGAVLFLYFSIFIFVMYQIFSNILSLEIHKVSVSGFFSLFIYSRHTTLC